MSVRMQAPELTRRTLCHGHRPEDSEMRAEEEAQEQAARQRERKHDAAARAWRRGAQRKSGKGGT